MTGQWTAVGGSCVPDNGGNSCSALPPIDPPKNSLGWRKQACYTTGFGPRATTTCYATCVNGCSGSGSNGYDPYTVCSWATGGCCAEYAAAVLWGWKLLLLVVVRFWTGCCCAARKRGAAWLPAACTAACWSRSHLLEHLQLPHISHVAVLLHILLQASGLR